MNTQTNQPTGSSTSIKNDVSILNYTKNSIIRDITTFCKAQEYNLSYISLTNELKLNYKKTVSYLVIFDDKTVFVYFTENKKLVTSLQNFSKKQLYMMLCNIIEYRNFSLITSFNYKFDKCPIPTLEFVKEEERKDEEKRKEGEEKYKREVKEKEQQSETEIKEIVGGN